MVYICNPSTQEAKAGGMAQILKASLGYITKLFLKNGGYGKERREG